MNSTDSPAVNWHTHSSPERLTSIVYFMFKTLVYLLLVCKHFSAFVMILMVCLPLPPWHFLLVSVTRQAMHVTTMSICSSSTQGHKYVDHTNTLGKNQCKISCLILRHLAIIWINEQMYAYTQTKLTDFLCTNNRNDTSMVCCLSALHLHHLVCSWHSWGTLAPEGNCILATWKFRRSTTIPKPRGIPPSACSDTSSL